MTDQHLFDNLDSGQLADLERLPDCCELPDDYWDRPVRIVQVTGGRL